MYSWPNAPSARNGFIGQTSVNQKRQIVPTALRVMIPNIVPNMGIRYVLIVVHVSFYRRCPTFL